VCECLWECKHLQASEFVYGWAHTCMHALAPLTDAAHQHVMLASNKHSSPAKHEAHAGQQHQQYEAVHCWVSASVLLSRYFSRQRKAVWQFAATAGEVL